MKVWRSRTELAWQHAPNIQQFKLHQNSFATYCDSRRSGRGKPRSPARQAGPTGCDPTVVRCILPEWTFGEAEPSSHGDTPKHQAIPWAGHTMPTRMLLQHPDCHSRNSPGRIFKAVRRFMCPLKAWSLGFSMMTRRTTTGGLLKSNSLTI